jgi:uroporphyrinogen-III decarboxylase
MTQYKLTEKENYLRMLNGEFPEFLPRFDMMNWMGLSGLNFGKVLPNGNRVTEFGVEMVSVADAEGGPIPVPGKFILKDITKWRDVIKAPDLKEVDWEAQAAKDLKDKDRTNNPYMMFAGDFFQALMGFMGFTEGLCAMYEEPDEVYALFDYLCDYYIEKYKNYLLYYKPDGMYLGDDTATKLNPFISPDMHKRLIKPFQKREADLARENGLPIQMHNCGRCEDFIEDWLDIGVSAWDPAQVTNNLIGIKKKYGRRLCLAGCWDSSGPASWTSTSDEILKDELAKYVDTYAPGGGFMYTAYVMGAVGDEVAKRKKDIIQQFYEDYARDWYKRNGYN